jgi:tRNA(Met) C34 N-acetyltransferase TmcA
MANYKKWTESELNFVRDNHTTMNDLELSAKLSQMTGQNISTAMIRRQRRKLSIKKSRGRPKKAVVISSVAIIAE